MATSATTSPASAAARRSPPAPATWSTGRSGCSATYGGPRTSCRCATTSYLFLLKCLEKGKEDESEHRAYLDPELAEPLDLTGRSLRRANLSGSKLWKASFRTAQLQGADLSGAQLQGADLGGAQLQGADLSGAQLQGADLSGAQLQGAN